MNTMNTKEIISKNIVGLRKKAKMTQQDLAEKLYYSDKAVSKWERGESLQDAEMLANIAKLFNVDVNYLFTDHDYKELSNDENASLLKRERTFKIIFALTIASIVLVLFEIIIASFIPYLDNSHYLVGAILFVIPFIESIVLIVSLIIGRKRYARLLLSLILWSFVIAFYYFFLNLHLVILYALGVVVQIAIVVFPRIGEMVEKTSSKEEKNSEK